MSKARIRDILCLILGWGIISGLVLVSCGKAESPVFCLKVNGVSGRVAEFRELASDLAKESGLKEADQSGSRKIGRAGYALSIRAEDSSVAVGFLGGEEEYGFACIYGAAGSPKVNAVSMALVLKLERMKYSFSLDKRAGFGGLQENTQQYLSTNSTN